MLEDKGDVRKVRKFLGRNYSIEGKVVEGKKLGRDLGYPTANIDPENKFKLIPKIGIYVVQAELDGKSYQGMMSIGRNPTVTEDNTINLK